jgi:hypothetical protein
VTPLAKRAVMLSGGFLALVVAMSFVFVSFDSAAVRGVAVGAALGIANLVVGLFVTRRALSKGMHSATNTLIAGFGVRFVLLVALFLLFEQTTAIDAAAFGLTFVAFFFVYLAAEIVMVEQSRAPRSA